MKFFIIRIYLVHSYHLIPHPNGIGCETLFKVTMWHGKFAIKIKITWLTNNILLPLSYSIALYRIRVKMSAREVLTENGIPNRANL